MKQVRTPESTIYNLNAERHHRTPMVIGRTSVVMLL